MNIISVEWIDAALGMVFIRINDNGGEVQISGSPPFAVPYGELYEEWLQENTPSNPQPPVLLPANSPLSPNQFYTMLENDGKLEAFIDAIETVTPTSKKLTCRNQFNNSTVFTWEMILVTQVMSKAAIYGANWKETLAPLWLNAYTDLVGKTT